MTGLPTSGQATRSEFAEADFRVDHPIALSSLEVTRRRYGEDTELIRLGRPISCAFIVEKGWAFAHRSLKSGARQVTSVYVAGDLIGFPPVSRGEMCRADVSVCAVTEAHIAEIGFAPLKLALEREPMLARSVLKSEARASAMLQERLISLGRRSASSRTAHFFLELSVRVSSADVAFINRFACPLSQYIVSDALGLSAEHLNRILRQLRLAQLLQVRSGMVEILDRTRLGQLSDFDPDYLSMD